MTAAHIDNDEGIMKRRFEELSRRSVQLSRWIYSDFLSPADQSLLINLGYSVEPYTLIGGWSAAERRIACFGSEDNFYCPAEPPIVCVKIAPKMAKFSGRMGHRDFLGSLMALGIKRETLGDILIRESCAWLFCLNTMADHIIRELDRVGNTSVRCELSDAPDFTVTVPDPANIAAASDRVDALCAAVYNLSRNESKDAILAGLVFVDSKMVTDGSLKVKPGSLVNLRGRGRFLYNGSAGQTHSGRLRASVSIYK